MIDRGVQKLNCSRQDSTSKRWGTKVFNQIIYVIFQRYISTGWFFRNLLSRYTFQWIFVFEFASYLFATGKRCYQAIVSKQIASWSFKRVWSSRKIFKGWQPWFPGPSIIHHRQFIVRRYFCWKTNQQSCKSHRDRFWLCWLWYRNVRDLYKVVTLSHNYNLSLYTVLWQYSLGSLWLMKFKALNQTRTLEITLTISQHFLSRGTSHTQLSTFNKAQNGVRSTDYIYA